MQPILDIAARAVFAGAGLLALWVIADSVIKARAYLRSVK